MKDSRQKYRGFTLIEVLVSMVVLALIMVLTVQMVGRATSITSASNKQMDAASLARIALDRIGADLGGAGLTGGATALYYSGSTGTTIDPLLDSAIGFVCKSRARKPLDNHSVAIQDVRGIIVGYKIRPAPLTLSGKKTADLPMISRGDAVFTFLTDGSTNEDKYGFSIWNLFGTAGSKQLPTDLTAAAGRDTSLLGWTGFGDGILRFHISFVLDDGRIVQSLRQPATSNFPVLDATYQGFQSNGGIGDCLPIAFSAATSADLNKRYVQGLIIGIAVLDQTTLAASYLRDNNFISNLALQLKRPVKDGETPLEIWQANLSQLTSLPVRQNIRFYQRFYSINL